MRRVLQSAALMGAALLAASADAQDSRLVERTYNPKEIVRVEGKPTVQATIRFAENEHIENIAIGDSTKWQVTPNKRANLLFLKPMADRASTNMTVVTDRHTYLFDLVADPLFRRPLYILSFTYPAEKLEHIELANSNATAEEQEAAADPASIADPSQLNFAWRHKGTSKLLPSRVFDDGEATFLTWPTGATLPAILVKDAHGTEGPVNYSVRGAVIAVEGVPREIVLRSGREIASLINEGSPRGTVDSRVARQQKIAQVTTGVFKK